MLRNFKIQNSEAIESKLIIEGDYAIAPFRLLSAGIIEGYWIDFSEDILKAAVEKFNNITVFPDHEPNIRDWIGVVTNARITNSKGVLGIDADFKIDIVQNPEIIRGLQMSPPAIKHCSVGVRIDGKPSHRFETKWEFERKLGKMIDGQVVRTIVTEIMDVNEVSLVYKGADPHATRLIAVGDSQGYSKEIDLKVKKGTLVLLGHKVDGPDEVDITPEELHSVVEKFAVDSEKKFTELKESTKAIAEEHKLLKEASTKALTDARTKALATYRQYANGSENAGVVAFIESAPSVETAEAFALEYKTLLEKKFPVNPETGTRASFNPGEEKNKINFKEYEV